MGKKAASKVPVVKQIWQWTESVRPENITEEHVHTACRLKLGRCNSCRKNCSGNPQCLKGLGEAHWLREKGLHSAPKEELEQGQREDGEFVGLKNLGATCYVNTFLQLWFHNLSFRKAVYSCNEETTENNSENSDSTVSVCGHLQRIFGMMQCSCRKDIDPSSLISFLGLDTGLQQDAQEFSKLFLNLLESVPTVGDFLCREFCGEYDYQTTCHTCGQVSERPSKFFELDLSIQGHRDVVQCLREFFKEEQMKCENQYHCDSCQCKRDASRKIIVRSLPRTLNLQLLRFVFDKTTYNKKKLSTVISFPNTLDMSSVVSLENTPQDKMIYELTAVLIHRGPSASSGHYIAHIKDDATQLWYKFNDEAIVKMKSGKTLDLDALKEDNYESDLLPKPAKKPRIKKDHHSSKNAYMLVYTKKNDMEVVQNTSDIPLPPAHIQKIVEEDNAGFKSCLEAVHLEAKRKAEDESKFHENMSALVKLLNGTAEYSQDSLDSLWVPTAWLKQILDPNVQDKKGFTLDKFKCVHDKLDPDRIGTMKYIDGYVGESFMAMCKEECPRISRDMLCIQCVQDRCFSMRFNASLKEDYALVTKLLKESTAVYQTYYYVGRSTLRYWKTIAMRNHQDSIRTENSVEEDQKMPDLKQVNGAGSDSNQVDKESEGEDEDLGFNEDLLCEHGNLTTNSKDTRTVPEVVWNIFLKYFPKALAYNAATAEPCCTCRDEEYYKAQETELKRLRAIEQKSQLHDLFHNKNRPNNHDIHDKKVNAEIDISFYVVSSDFVQRWRECLRNPSKNESVCELNNQILLCPHNKLLYDPILSSMDCTESGPHQSEPNAVLLWPQEWNYLSRNFIVDTVITISRLIPISDNSVNSKEPTRLAVDRIQNGRDISDEEKRNDVGKTEIGMNDGVDNNGGHDLEVKTDVRAEKDDINLNSASEFKVNITSSLSKHTTSNGDEKVNFVYSPAICMDCVEGRLLEEERQLKSYKSAEIYIRKIIPDENSKSDLANYRPPQQASTTSRRSRRAHAARGEKALTVSSEWTLKKLKIQIMSLFSIPPFDQNIWFKCRKLVEDEVTLGNLSIIPGSTLLVIADEPDEKMVELLPVVDTKQSVLEEGFKGTGLLQS